MEWTSVVVQGVPVSAGPRALLDVACEKGGQVKPRGLSTKLAESGQAAWGQVLLCVGLQPLWGIQARQRRGGGGWQVFC